MNEEKFEKGSKQQIVDGQVSCQQGMGLAKILHKTELKFARRPIVMDPGSTQFQIHWELGSVNFRRALQ